MKKVISIIFFNIFLFFILLFLLNNFCIKNTKGDVLPQEIINIKNNYDEINLDKYNIEEEVQKKIHYDNLDSAHEQFCKEERREFGKNFKKNPIVVFGCSYAYGYALKNEQSFPYLLSNISKRPVYNFAECGGDILTSVNYLEQHIQEVNNIEAEIKKADYYVYVYMCDHIVRLIQPWKICLYNDEFFNSNQIVKKLSKIYLFKYIFARIKMGKMLQNYPYEIEKSAEYLEKIILDVNRKIKKISPDAKFIIIIYDEKLQLNEYNNKAYVKYTVDIMNNSLWKRLESKGITIVHSKDLTGFLFDKNYKLEYTITNWHPNEKAWELLTPLFADKYIQ